MIKSTKPLFETQIVKTRHSNYQTKISSSKDAYHIISEIFGDYQIGVREILIAVFLNASNQINGYTILSMGGVTATVGDVKLLCLNALGNLATSVILVHNHPSGNLKPSHQDIQLTKKFKNALQTLDIGLVDHIIISEIDQYFSFADEGII